MPPTRDSDYYLNNQSIVLEIEDVLFKIDISRLASQSEVFKGMLELPSGSDDAEGGNDADPVKLPQIGADEFRNLLYIFYRPPWPPSDATFVSFMAGASESANRNLATFKRYLDIAKLSRRFCMSESEEWAQTQVQEILGDPSFAYQLTTTQLLDALTYIKLCAEGPEDPLILATNSTLYYVVTQLDETKLFELYKGLAIDSDRALQGLVFLSILKHGHKSLLWDQLTWSERATLYGSLANLTPLPSSWPFKVLHNARETVHESGLAERASIWNPATCQQACNCLHNSWSTRINHGRWTSNIPLQAINELAELPRARKDAQTAMHNSCTCGKGCAKLLLTRVDVVIEEAFVKIANLRDKLSER